jgi:parallel beta-helix repeat protein
MKYRGISDSVEGDGGRDDTSSRDRTVSRKVSGGPYTPHAPIYITNDSGFTLSANNFTGAGTESNPYTLTGFSFSTNVSTLIHIENTTKNFEIFDNFLDGLDKSNKGIFLKDVTNGTVLANIIEKTSYGIYLQNTNRSFLMNNSVSQSMYNGVFLANSPFNTISGNQALANSAHGISVTASSNTTISENDVTNNSKNGISGFNSSFLIIDDNYVESNGWDGIILTRSPNSTISNNNIMSNFQNGLSVDYMDDSYVTSNTIAYNIWIGITVGSNTNNLEISNNDVYDNQNWAGIELKNSTATKVIENSIYNHNFGNGITLGYWGTPLTDTYFLIHNNSIYNNRYRGIRAEFSSNNTITYNDVHSNMEDGIELHNSSNNVIEYNSFHANSWNGILAENSSFNNISNNLIFANHQMGIYLDNSHFNLVDFNSIYDNYMDGIALINSHNNVLADNYIDSNGHGGSTSFRTAFYLDTKFSVNQALRGSGIFLDPSNNNEIRTNVIVNNKENGIYLLDSDQTQIDDNVISDNLNGVVLQKSALNSITNNLIFDNGQEGSGTVPNNPNTSFAVDQALRGSGIFLDPSDSNLIDGNHVFGNTGHGIYLTESTDVSVSNNVVSVNWLYGIYLNQAQSGSSITMNDFRENNIMNPDAGSQAYDDGNGNYFDMNYWSDFEEGQVFYEIDGLAGNSDQNPSPTPFHVPSYEFTPPIVQHPNGGEILSGIISIDWKMTLDMTETYWIFYSDNAGVNWNLIYSETVSSISFPGSPTDFSIDWDTTTVVNGSEYLIKIVIVNAEGFIVSDISDGTFEITNVDKPDEPKTTTGDTTQPTISPGWSFGLFLLTMVVTISILRSRRKTN